MTDSLFKNDAFSAWSGALSAQNALPSWQPLLKEFLNSEKGIHLATSLWGRLAQGAVIYPPEPLRVFSLTPLDEVRIVILGQDPYHGAGQAEGLAFSVQRGIKIPPSLRNIFKEIQRDLGAALPGHGSLLDWARQGILLLNTCLTVEENRPASHAKKGWETLTDAVFERCAEQTSPKVFMLWGAHAQAKRALIEAHNADARHLILSANHPSPLSALRAPEPFIGCGHFGAACQWLGLEASIFTRSFV